MATNKEELQKIINCSARFLMTTYMNGGDNDTIAQDYIKKCESLLEEVQKNLDWNDIDEETANILQFGIWSDENPKFRLIPLYLYNIVPVGLNVVGISSGAQKWDGKQDKDHRFGFLGFGIEVK